MEQPSNDMKCNPYPTNTVVTRCIVDHSASEGTPLNVAWYSRRHSDGIAQPITGSDSTMIEPNRVRSELTLDLTLPTGQQYEGLRYFCRVWFNNGTLLRDSQEYYLFDRSLLTTGLIDFPDCDANSV